MLARGPLLLCLDFDGTISTIVPHPADARPVDGATEVLRALASHPDRLRVAIVSGREVSQVQKMLGIDRGILFSGTHGLEIVGANGVRHFAKGVEHSERDLAKVRAWLKEHTSEKDGFVIEDKRVAIAMHYRMVNPTIAAERRTALHTFVETKTPALQIMEGNRVDEMLPRAVGGKGRAIRMLLDDIGQPATWTIYFGDDTTDEDAFHELRDDGVGVLVGPQRASWARYRVDNPHEVLRLLAELSHELARSKN